MKGLLETVILIGALEQNKFLPSLSGIVGIRNVKGAEFGVGPNLSLAGVGLVFSAGFTVQSNTVNFPINFAVAPSSKGARFSILFGFTSRKK